MPFHRVSHARRAISGTLDAIRIALSALNRALTPSDEDATNLLETIADARKAINGDRS